MQAGAPGQGGVTAGGPTKEALKRCASCKVVRYCSQVSIAGRYHSRFEPLISRNMHHRHVKPQAGPHTHPNVVPSSVSAELANSTKSAKQQLQPRRLIMAGT